MLHSRAFSVVLTLEVSDQPEDKSWLRNRMSFSLTEGTQFTVRTKEKCSLVSNEISAYV